MTHKYTLNFGLKVHDSCPTGRSRVLVLDAGSIQGNLLAPALDAVAAK
jgi:hypothetical protein